MSLYANFSLCHDEIMLQVVETRNHFRLFARLSIYFSSSTIKRLSLYAIFALYHDEIMLQVVEIVMMTMPLLYLTNTDSLIFIELAY
jgi:hypothetical protein